MKRLVCDNSIFSVLQNICSYAFESDYCSLDRADQGRYNHDFWFGAIPCLCVQCPSLWRGEYDVCHGGVLSVKALCGQGPFKSSAPHHPLPDTRLTHHKRVRIHELTNKYTLLALVPKVSNGDLLMLVPCMGTHELQKQRKKSEQ